MIRAARTDLPPAGLRSDEAAARILEGLKPATMVKDVTVETTAGRANVTVRMDHFDDRVAQVWYADLAYGAIVELTRQPDSAASDTIQAVATATVSGTTKNGESITIGLGIGAAGLGQRFDSPSDETLKARARHVAEKYGLTVVDAQVLHPLESALHVVYEVPTNADIEWRIDQLRTDLVGEPAIVEGALIELISDTGKPLLTTAGSYRTATGGVEFAPGQDTRFGALHGHRPIANSSRATARPSACQDGSARSDIAPTSLRYRLGEESLPSVKAPAGAGAGRACGRRWRAVLAATARRKAPWSRRPRRPSPDRQTAPDYGRSRASPPSRRPDPSSFARRRPASRLPFGASGGLDTEHRRAWALVIGSVALPWPTAALTATPTAASRTITDTTRAITANSSVSTTP